MTLSKPISINILEYFYIYFLYITEYNLLNIVVSNTVQFLWQAEIYMYPYQRSSGLNRNTRASTQIKTQNICAIH